MVVMTTTITVTKQTKDMLRKSAERQLFYDRQKRMLDEEEFVELAKI